MTFLLDKLALSIPEAAELVGLSQRSIRRLIDSGVIARVPNTDRVLIARVELDRWLASSMGEAS